MIAFLVACLLAPGLAIRDTRDPASFFTPKKFDKFAGHAIQETYKGYKYQEEFLVNVPVDHFSFTHNKTFSLRYFINDENFKCNKPILFYTGNEGQLEGFAENTGFMWDIAAEFNAAVIFAEHRFYGKSQPFGNDSYKSVENLGYLSSEQALADFAFLIDNLKNKRIKCAQHSAVIAFGGSYGGMLSAWMRVKYPHLVQGAIAASAPVFWFVDSGIEEDIFDRIVTRSFTGQGCELKAVEGGWHAIGNLSQTDAGRKFLNDLFKLEEKSQLQKAEDGDFLIAYAKEVFESMAMVDYPYPTTFLAALPGWPVKKSCTFLREVAKSEEDAATAIYNVVNLFYNYTGTTTSLCANSAVCSGAFAALGDPLGWPWQTCTEMLMPQCASGTPNDFFPKDCPFTEKKYLQDCHKWFDSIGYTEGLMRSKWATRSYGSNSFPTATNIVFSNGYLDPWSGGGWSQEDKQDGSLIGVILREGAHHYDLRGAHPDDTEEVKKVRELEKTNIRTWVKQYDQKWKNTKEKYEKETTKKVRGTSAMRV